MSDNVAAGAARRSQSVATGVFDLRRWLEKAKAIGQLTEVEGAELRFELGCITDLNAKRGGPPLLFKNFKGYKEGFRVQTGSMMNAATLGLTMGFEGALSDLEVVNKVAEILQSVESRAADFPVEYVTTGSVMENVVTGDDVDLTIFPTPTWHELDGGPYIGTACWQVFRDPDTGWVNVGTYRNQLLGKNVVGNLIDPGHHGDLIRRKYWNRGQPCPIAVGFGGHPLIFLMSMEQPGDHQRLQAVRPAGDLLSGRGGITGADEGDQGKMVALVQVM